MYKHTFCCYLFVGVVSISRCISSTIRCYYFSVQFAHFLSHFSMLHSNWGKLVLLLSESMLMNSDNNSTMYQRGPMQIFIANMGYAKLWLIMTLQQSRLNENLCTSLGHLWDWQFWNICNIHTSKLTKSSLFRYLFEKLKHFHELYGFVQS